MARICPSTRPAVLITRRLTLRAPHEVDADALAVGLNDLEVSRWLGTVPHPYAVADAEEWLARVAARPNSKHWTLHDGRGLVGSVALHARSQGERSDDAPTGERVLGYWLARRSWGQGLMTEAVLAVLHDHFDNSNADVVASAQACNIASLRVQEKMGFERTGIGRERSLATGKEADSVVSRLTLVGFRAHHPVVQAA